MVLLIILLKNGTVEFAGDCESTVNYYLSDNKSNILNSIWSNTDEAPGNDYVRMKEVKVDADKTITVNNSIKYRVKFELLQDNINLNLSSHLYNLKGDCIFNVVTDSKVCSKGIYEGSFTIPEKLLNDDHYQISTMFVENRARSLFKLTDSVKFEVTDDREDDAWFGKWPGAIRPTTINYSFDKQPQ